MDSFFLCLTGYESPTTGAWVGGIRPGTVDYVTAYFTKDPMKSRGMDLVWHGPFKSGDDARIPDDDASSGLGRARHPTQRHHQ